MREKKQRGEMKKKKRKGKEKQKIDLKSIDCLHAISNTFNLF